MRSEHFQFLFVSKIGSDLSLCRVWSPARIIFPAVEMLAESEGKQENRQGTTNSGVAGTGLVVPVPGWLGDIPVL